MSLKIALNSYSGYGAHFILRLLEEGHKVDYFLTNPEVANVLGGIIPPPKIINRRLWPDYSKYDVSVFDLTGRETQSEYSASLTPTIGDGAFNNSVENDRKFGMEVMEECGIELPPYFEFTDTAAAKTHIKKTGKRYVYKPDGGQDQDTDTTYVSESADDMLEYIDKVFTKTKGAPFVLQEFIKGTEVSVEGWFNGEDFYLINCTLEEKKFMNGGKGPNTGCAGNLVFTLKHDCKLVIQGLMKMKDFLRNVGYTGMIDLNTIATPQGLYGLEWTPRFGYDASATLLQMYSGDFGELLYRTGVGKIPEDAWRAEFAAGIRLSIPPYPTEIRGKHPQGVPVKGIEEDSYLSTFLYDVEFDKKQKQLVTAGHSGFIAVPTGIGNSIGEAFARCEARIDKINIPNMQIRTDIKSSVMKRYNELQNLGLLS